MRRRDLLLAGIAAPAVILASSLGLHAATHDTSKWTHERTQSDVIVRFLPGVSVTDKAVRDILAAHKAKQAEYWAFIRTYMFAVPDGADAEALAADLDESGLVIDADPNHVGRPHQNDPYYTGVSGTSNALATMNCPSAWALQKLNGSAVAPVLDFNTGILATHPDFTTSPVGTPIITGWNLTTDNGGPNNVTTDVQGHGTECAGYIAAPTNNSTGVASVGYGGVVQPIKISAGSSGTTTNALFISGFQWVIANVTAPGIINMPWGFGSWVVGSAIDVACSACWNAGFLLLSSTGDTFGFPAATSACNNAYTIGVTAVTYQLAAESYSGYGPSQGAGLGAIMSACSSSLSVTADFFWTLNLPANGTYTHFGGTSFSVTVGAAVAQFIWQAKPSMKNWDVAYLLTPAAAGGAGLGQNVTGFTGASGVYANPQCVDLHAMYLGALNYKGLPASYGGGASLMGRK